MFIFLFCYTTNIGNLQNSVTTLEEGKQTKLKLVNVTIGDVTIPSSNYYTYKYSSIPGATYVGLFVFNWAHSSGPFNAVTPLGGQVNEIYVNGSSGTTITKLVVTLLYY